MKEVTAAGLRQSLGSLARTLARTGEPVLLRLAGRPVGVIISMRDFQERFALARAAEDRRRLVEEILADRRPGAVPVDRALAELRGS